MTRLSLELEIASTSSIIFSEATSFASDLLLRQKCVINALSSEMRKSDLFIFNVEINNKNFKRIIKRSVFDYQYTKLVINTKSKFHKLISIK